ncbi:MAG: hypothetical protein HC857_13220 [Synechococcales cyanobacterium RU_4_20]|nr:hypothetical protein [Synechococcales cyanobacterium RU_4_20]NJR70873.1 hypothetical protein [Synechococcales cyanobacterium CRU_2_2]
MTRKATLNAWAKRLGAELPADATVSQLEAAIEQAIAHPTDQDPECPGITRGELPMAGR